MANDNGNDNGDPFEYPTDEPTERGPEKGWEDVGLTAEQIKQRDEATKAVEEKRKADKKAHDEKKIQDGFDAAALAKRLEGLTEERDLQSQVNNLTVERLALIAKEAASYERLNKAIDVRRENLKATADEAKKVHKVANDAALKEVTSLEKRLLLQTAAMEKEKAAKKAAMESAIAEGEDAEEQRKNYERESNLLDQKIKKLKDSAAAANELGTAVGAAFKIDKAVNFTASVEKVGKAMSTSTGAMALFSKGFTSIATSLIDSMIGLVVSIVDAENAFRKITGASQEFAGSMMETWHATKRFGVSMEEATAAHADLYKSFTDFTMLAPEVRQELGDTIAVLSKFGISTQDAAKSVQMMTKAMGVIPGQADDMLLGLKDFAIGIGVAPAQMAADFANASSELAKFGDAGMKAFKGIAIQAKLTGMELPKLLALVAKFDTFEDAAKQAGMLNAALGGNFVNAMDLLMETDPAARFNMIRDAIKQTGLSFTDMSYYQRLFYTEALGLGDVSELAFIMSDRMDLLGDKTDESAQSMIESAEQALAFQSTTEQLKAALIEMVPILTPLVVKLRDMLKYAAENTETFKFWGKAILIWGTALKGASIIVSLLGAALATVSSPITATIAAFVGLAMALRFVIYWLFERTGSPTFYEGIKEFGGIFDGMAKAIDRAVAGLRRLAAAVKFTNFEFNKPGSPSFLEAVSDLMPKNFLEIEETVRKTSRAMMGLGGMVSWVNHKFNEKHSPSFLEGLAMVGEASKAGLITGATRSGEIGGAGAVAGAVGGSIVPVAGNMVGGVSAGTLGAVVGGATGFVEGFLGSVYDQLDESSREEARAKTYVGRAPEGFVASVSAPGYGATPGVAAPQRFTVPTNAAGNMMTRPTMQTFAGAAPQRFTVPTNAAGNMMTRPTMQTFAGAAPELNAAAIGTAIEKERSRAADSTPKTMYIQLDPSSTRAFLEGRITEVVVKRENAETRAAVMGV